MKYNRSFTAVVAVSAVQGCLGQKWCVQYRSVQNMLADLLVRESFQVREELYVKRVSGTTRRTVCLASA
jgi:hypothetical protein